MTVAAETPSSSRRRKREVLKQTAALRSALSGLGDVRDPGEAEEPILSLPVRSAIHSWLVELNNLQLLEDVKVEPRSTALLSGPPGCGKTTLAHHLAARIGVPLVCVGSEGIFDAQLGASERNMARLFNALAAAETPCVVLLDEIDAIGGKRVQETGGGGARSAMNSTLNVMLRRIEEYEGILIGATNFAEGLDPALWRRFAMQIEIALPSDDERYAILRRYAEPFDFSEDGFELLTDLTTSAAPSLLRQLMEGVKRLLALGTKMGLASLDAVSAFTIVTGQVKPHPDVEPPPLWRGRVDLRDLAGIPWPPPRIGDAP